MTVNNVNLAFDLPSPMAIVSVNFADFGGNVNLDVKGDFQNVEDMQDLPATVGGASVNVSATNTPGSLSLAGNITSFAIGGQEFFLDDVVMRALPEPASLGACLVALLCLALPRGKQYQAFENCS